MVQPPTAPMLRLMALDRKVEPLMPAQEAPATPRSGVDSRASSSTEADTCKSPSDLNTSSNSDLFCIDGTEGQVEQESTHRSVTGSRASSSTGADACKSPELKSSSDSDVFGSDCLESQSPELKSSSDSDVFGSDCLESQDACHTPQLNASSDPAGHICIDAEDLFCIECMEREDVLEDVVELNISTAIEAEVKADSRRRTVHDRSLLPCLPVPTSPYSIRNTFIEELSEPEPDRGLVRSTSLPDFTAIDLRDDDDAEDMTRRYLLSPFGREGQSPLVCAHQVCGDISWGSVGHPQLCNRPCEWAFKGHCRNGKACNACHSCASHRRKRSFMDKRNRTALRRLGFADRLRVFLPLLRAKASVWSFEAEAAEFFEELAAGAAADGASRLAVGSFNCTALRKAFAHCTFGEVLRHSFLTASHPQSSHMPVEAVRRAYDALRTAL